jgi:hypothetical protein
MVRESSLGGFPYSLGLNGNITGSTSGTSYYWFYNWAMTQACESPRVPVTATVNTPPAVNLVISPNDTICQGQSVTMAATSVNDPDYTYTWSYNGTSTVFTGSNFVFTPSQDTSVYFRAEDLSAGPNAGCVFIDTNRIVVNDSMVTPIVSPANSSICDVGNCVNLIVTNSSTITPVTGTIGTQTTTLSTTGNPFRGGFGTGSDVKTQILITASELTGIGFVAGNITSMGFTFTVAGGTMANLTIKMGNTSVTGMTTTYLTTPMTTVYTAATYNAFVGFNNFVFSSPFAWDGVSNVVVEFCENNQVTGTNTVHAWTPAYTPNNHAGGAGICTATTGATNANKPVMTLSGFTGTTYQ